MTKITFSTLPAEIHISIAQQCEGNDLFNLCRASKWAYKTFLPVLYRHVDLQRERSGLDLSAPHEEFDQMWDAFKRQQQLVYTLLKRPEYGRYIRSFKGMLCSPKLDPITDQKLWNAMESLTRVDRVEIGTSASNVSLLAVPSVQIPSGLFQSVTSVTLLGEMQYGLAKSILSAINPAALQHLCLDKVQDRKCPRFKFKPGDEAENGRNCSLFKFKPGDKAENGRLIARGAITDLLTSLTGRCTSLRTLILRRIGESGDLLRWHAAAEEASYTEWADFIRSVQATVEKVLFEQVVKAIKGTILASEDLPFRTMDQRFRQLVFPTLVSGTWPCLTVMELRGVRGSKSEGGTAGLAMGLRLVHSETIRITVTELAHHFVHFYEN